MKRSFVVACRGGGLPRSLEVIMAAEAVRKLGLDVDRPYSSFYSGRRSDLEFESGPGLGIGIGM